VKSVITWSPRVPGGTQASNEQVDFDVGTLTDKKFIRKLGDVCFYLNDSPTRSFIPFITPLSLVAIGHPHGSNKRISFGSVN